MNVNNTKEYTQYIEESLIATWNINKNKTHGSLSGKFEYESGARTGESTWVLEQDETPFLEHAKLDREESHKKDVGYKKFATIPDIVAIEILQNHGIDLHDPNTMQDKTLMNKFRYIVKSEYPYLLSF